MNLSRKLWGQASESDSGREETFCYIARLHGPRGGIGRRDGFKIRCLHGRASSSLAEGTKLSSKILKPLHLLSF